MMVMFKDHLTKILGITEALNEMGSKGLTNIEGYYLKVELCSSHDGEVVGSWNDEISGEDWSYEVSGQ